MDPARAGQGLLVAEDAWSALGTEVELRPDHTAVRFAPAVLARGGNLFRSLRLPASADPDEFLEDRLLEAGEWGWPWCRLEIDDRTFPANFGDTLGSHEFLPRVFLGLVARAPAVVSGRRFVAVRAAEATDTAVVESLLATEQFERRASADEAAAAIELARARFWSPQVQVWLAHLDERPAGHAVVFEQDGLHYVRRLFVAEACRQQGVATALLRTVADAAGRDGLVGLFADTATDLPEFYRARGFVAVTRRETWIRRADD